MKSVTALAEELFSPYDMEKAARLHGAACGHGALAAALGVPVVVACLVCFRGHGYSWVGLPQMRSALHASERQWREIGKAWPRHGVSLLQWLGPWTEPNKPRIWRYRHRHWVASHGDLVWDVNLEMWLPRLKWAQYAHDELFPSQGTGYEVVSSFEVAEK